jgi:NMD protein affecting ribosome stability and mRNA decay
MHRVAKMKTADISPVPDRLGLNPQEKRHDPYAARQKPAGPSVCTQCGAAFVDGRWTWQKELPENLANTVCPACQRVNGKYPAGEVTLTGEFIKRHAQEIMAMLRREADLENREHPLNRIIAIREDAESILVTTTNLHLPRRFLHALERAYKGRSEIHYDEEGYYARATWHRDD